MDFVQIGIGFIIGVIATSMAIEFGLRKLLIPKPDMRLTALWRISDVTTQEPPLIVAEDIRGVKIPPGSRIILKEVKKDADPNIFAASKIRVNSDVNSNFAIGEEKLLIFSSSIAPGVLGLWTSNDVLYKRLKSEFDRLWAGSKEYREIIHVSEIQNKIGIPVVTKGAVLDVKAYGKKWLLTLGDEGYSASVIADQGPELEKKIVVVLGRVQKLKDQTVLMADRIKL